MFLRVTLVLSPPCGCRGSWLKTASPRVPGCGSGSPVIPSFILWCCFAFQAPSLNTANSTISSRFIPSSHQYLLSAYHVPGPFRGATAVNKATTPPGPELTAQWGHRHFPDLTWKLSCDQWAQDEVPRAREPVPAFDFGRKVQERFPEDRRGNSGETGRRCVPGHGNSMFKGPVVAGEGW